VFIEAKDYAGGGDNWTTEAISRAKLQWNHHRQQTNIQFVSYKLHFKCFVRVLVHTRNWCNVNSAL